MKKIELKEKVKKIPNFFKEKAKNITNKIKQINFKEWFNNLSNKIKNFSFKDLITKIKNIKPKTVFNFLKRTIAALLVTIAIFMMIFTLISVNLFDRNDRSLLGYKAYIVKSDSMSKTDFKAGDLIIVKEVEPETLEVGDIISFLSINKESYGETITHKIREKVEVPTGGKGFITYGTTTDENDTAIVTYEFVIGKYIGHINNLGKFFNYLKTGKGYFTCIFIPFAILIAYQAYCSYILFKQFKEEKIREIEEKLEVERQKLREEQEKLEKERQEAKKILEEIKMLKEENSKKTKSTSTKKKTTKKSTSKKSTSNKKRSSKK